jgi:hypothetical protein
MSAQTWQTSAMNGDSRLMKDGQTLHISAQSMHSRAHSGIFSKQALAQWSHSWAQRKQASMQDLCC